MPRPKGLTRKQKVFVEELLICWNETEAARRAGFKHPNVQGPRLMLVNVSVQALVAQRIKEKGMNADECIARLSDHARVNISDFIREEPKAFTKGTGEDVEEYYIESGSINWDELKRKGHCVKKISFNQYGPVIETTDNLEALEKIAKALGLYKNNTTINLPDGPLVEQVLVYIPDNGRDKKNDTDRPTPAG